ncbi:N-acetylglucosaminyldiphosphoundecaprenol N-acetyl-beta-D-mannosaminyltransferase [Sporomusaceae bacterium BoRhaA]|uniref:WecB/TagA/CpsF family glycosyltransferase n=1 Tax=Pelorhabdus rhamnosifermentans TaxID=2772457 RepID=UPI0028A5B81C|nr:WecB/TagA/CpsF family glycosyltransferase [Pelorhabdus rhamnosifermentans]MBU2700349.1 N-acetylglucosaminyldiphosphoundecaprenol N-acetyl-beta-D-mannosaminyltransferase [Pelorhabdus rhamnosifermentans]
MQKQANILGVRVDSMTMDQAVMTVESMISGKSSYAHMQLVATANAEMVMMANEDKELATILAAAQLVVPDGAGVVWAAGKLGHPVPERVAGFDLAQRLFALSAEKGYRIYFLGGAPGVAVKAQAAARKRYGSIEFVGVHDGFFKAEEVPTLVASINESKADLLFVALGVPKQEKWLYELRNQLTVKVGIGVGGTFDVMAGVMKRAPLWMQKTNLEWLFRLMMQPQRALRMLALPRFVIKVLLSKKD